MKLPAPLPGAAPRAGSYRPFLTIMKRGLWHALPAVLMALLSLSAMGAEASDDVEQGLRLVLSSEQLEPTTTFELRFDEALVAFDQIGFVATEPPLVITPAIPGTFTWLSQRSGVFKPTAPPALGTNYQVTLRPGLQDAKGALLAATLKRSFQTPPFTASGFSPNEFDEEDAPSNPQIHIQFNADVTAETAAKFIVFRNADGTDVPALVSQTKRRDDYYFLGGEVASWQDRFAGKAPPEDRRKAMDAVLPNCLCATPARPLPPAKGWRLVLAKDLPSSDGTLHFPAPVELKIGDVIPFAVTKVKATNGAQGGKRIAISFSKRLSPQLQPADLLNWIGISPVPANLKADVFWGDVALSGDYNLTERYTVTIKAGIPAAAPFVLDKDDSRVVAFAPLPPRLYFPTFSTHQLAGGQRRFDLRSVNLQDVAVRAQLLTRETLVPLLRTYNKSYFKDWEAIGTDDNYEPYQRLNAFLPADQTIYEKTFHPAADRDATHIISLNWDDILGARKSAAVFLCAEAAAGRQPGTQAVVQITDLGLIWKYAGAEVMMYVFSHATGKPVAGVTVAALSDQNKTLVSQATDASGIVHLTVPGNTAWLLTEKDGDLHAVSFHLSYHHDNSTDRQGYYVSLYHFEIPQRWDDNRDDDGRRVLMFTDRPVYQPGETVHLKAIVRDWKAGELVVPETLTGVLRCKDSRSQTFLEQEVTVSPTGAFELSFTLPNGALGNYDYALSIDGDRQGHGGHFRVEQYKPNAFEIAMTAKAAYGADEAVAVPLHAQYYFGTPLAKARVKWSLEAADQAFQPDGFDQFHFGGFADEGSNAAANGSSFGLQGEGAVDPNGGFVLQPQISTNPQLPQPRRVAALAEITDLNQQTVSARALFIKHSSAFYLGIKRIGENLPAGEPAPVEFVAVNADGTPCTQAVAAQVELLRIDYRIIREESAGGALNYRTLPEHVRISQLQAAAGKVKKSGTAWEFEPPENPALITPPTPGGYLLRVATRDAAGHEVLAVATFNVVAKEPSLTTWDYRNEEQIDLVPDQTRYHPGESATILVKTPIGGEALVTVEREKVLRSFVTTLAGNAPTISVPLEKSDAPNVFISVMLVRGHEHSPRKIKTPDYRIGYCQLNVERPETKLEVRVQTEAPSYRPGQEVAVNTVVKDATGALVPAAEITLYAVDEGVLSLTGFTRPDPFAFFYATQALAIQTATSLPALLPEDPDRLDFSNKGYLVGGMGGEEGKARVRKDFLACAFWQADLVTDAAGQARATFKAPDSLTRYRLVAVAQTAKSQFGSAEANFEINKPLMLEPSLPRFGNVTDTVTARAVLFNQTKQAGEVELSVHLDGNAVSDGATVVSRKVQVAATSSVAVDFPVEFKQAGQTKWLWRARMTGEAGESLEDAVQSTLTVGYVAPLLHETLVGRTAEAKLDLLAKANPQFLEAVGTMQVRLANTRLLGLGEAVAYLQKYPYGCVEQTASRMIPWIIAAELGKAVPELNKAPDEINGAIEYGINRLLSMQTSDGGLTYWPGGREPMLWASAYGGLVLATARRYDHSIPVGCLDEICDYLKEGLRDTSACRDEFELAPRCLALYTLALSDKAEPSYHELVFKKRDVLSAESRALLALAVLESNGPAAMVEELINSKMPAQPQGGYWFGSGERELAVRLMAWTRYRWQDPAVDTLAEELMHACQQGRWSNTQENAWALLALASYAAKVETGTKQFGGSLQYGGPAAAFQLDDNKPLFAATHAIVPTTPEQPQAQPLQLSNPDQGMIFTMVQLEGRPRVAKQPRQDRGYSIQRSYAKINDDNTQSVPKDWRVGDRVLITLRIEVRQPAHYLAVDDPLPAVFEAVNPVFKTQEMNTGVDTERDCFSAFREIRTDRALFFADHIQPGNFTIRYLARVCAAGKVSAPAAKIEEMYHPERFGMSATEEVTTSSLE
ncbi:MAG: MG2 domain-containing protein [Verrucomicrobia bacterium]|nr:MG2 domain-containing protein [Verrucomicrobiota bacterium]